MSTLPDDDLYQNVGDTYSDTAYYPKEDAEQVEEKTKDDSIKAASYPIMADLEQWFRDQINSCDSIDNIQLDKMTVNGVTYERTVSIEGQLLAMRLLKNLLAEKYKEFEDFRREE